MAVLVHPHSVEQRRTIEDDSFNRDPPYWPPPRPHIPVDKGHSLQALWSITGFIGAIMVVAGLYAFNASSSTTVASVTGTRAPTPSSGR